MPVINVKTSSAITFKHLFEIITPDKAPNWKENFRHKVTAEQLEEIKNKWQRHTGKEPYHIKKFLEFLLDRTDWFTGYILTDRERGTTVSKKVLLVEAVNQAFGKNFKYVD